MTARKRALRQRCGGARRTAPRPRQREGDGTSSHRGGLDAERLVRMLRDRTLPGAALVGVDDRHPLRIHRLEGGDVQSRGGEEHVPVHRARDVVGLQRFGNGKELGQPAGAVHDDQGHAGDVQRRIGTGQLLIMSHRHERTRAGAIPEVKRLWTAGAQQVPSIGGWRRPLDVARKVEGDAHPRGAARRGVAIPKLVQRFFGAILQGGRRLRGRHAVDHHDALIHQRDQRERDHDPDRAGQRRTRRDGLGLSGRRHHLGRGRFTRRERRRQWIAARQGRRHRDRGWRTLGG